MDGLGRADPRLALQSAGSVGRDLLSVDWDATPLGGPEQWPASLVTVVRTVLLSRFSMWMAWGPDKTFFCNDAYRTATLGSKYPWALGRPASEVWEEIWPDIGPRIERVIRSGEATWDESLLLFLERSGYVEETYHTFSYSPLQGDHGETAGMLCVVTEDSERVIGEYRMATLRDLGLETAGAADEVAFLDAASRHLSDSGRSVPFSLVYLFEQDGALARLAGSSGIASRHPAAPAVIRSQDADSVWPAGALRAGGGPVLVGELDARFSELPTGDWDEPPTAALVLPLPDQASRGHPYGFLVAALNRYQQLDERYRSFLGLVAGQLASGIARARAYESERRRAEQLAELDAAKTTFFTNVSHELRTPLTLLLGPAQDALADDSRPLSLQQRTRIEVIARNADRLLKLVNELLDFSRLESGTVTARLEAVDLAAYTAELAGQFREAVERAGLELIIDCGDLGEPAMVDLEMWAKIVLNLLSNALKFTFTGSISVSMERSGDSARLSVTDTGVGIDEAEQRHLFDRFHRVAGARARSHEGSGIGLALVAELVALHQGAASVASVPESGSTFTVEIPIRSAALGDAAALAARADASSLLQQAESFLAEVDRWRSGQGDGAEAQSGGDDPVADAERPRVLVVDDNADMREYLASLLAGDYAVQAARDGVRALEIVRERAPDLVISDAMMPLLDGFELVAELRAKPETQQIPVIMVSARAGEEGTIEGLRAGADDYLVKPFSARELLARVKTNLELSRLRQQATERVDAERRRLEAVLEQMPEGVVLVEAPSGAQILANRQVKEILGHLPLADGVYQRSEFQAYDADGAALAPERYPIVRALQHGEMVRSEDVGYLTPDGERKILRVNCAPVRGRGGEIIAAVSVFQDVTDRVRSERLLAAQRDTLASIAAGVPLADTLERLAGGVEALLERSTAASIMLVSKDGRSLEHAASPSLPDSFSAAVDGLQIGPDTGCCGAAAHLGETVIAADIASDPRWAQYRELALAHGLRACWSVPIQSTGGQVTGTFAVYYREPGVPSEEELAAVQLMARTTAVAIDRDRAERDQLTRFADLQRSLLPPELPQVPGVSACATFQPGSRTVEVGGDFYDLFAVTSDSWAFMIGDVCGHGTEAAAATAIARHTARAVAFEQGDPHQVMHAVNRALLQSGLDRFATMIFACMEVQEGCVRIRMCRAGHPAPLIVRADGSLDEPGPHGPALGIWPDVSVPETALELGPGDALVMYTDGVTERNPLVDEQHGLRSVLGRVGGVGATTLLAELESAVLARQSLRDDAAIFVLSNSQPPAPAQPKSVEPQFDTSYRATAESVPQARSSVARFATEVAGAHDELLDRIRLAVSEAVTNAVIHAYPGGDGSFRVTAFTRAGELTIAVTDEGCGYLKPAGRSGLGMGLAVMAEVCDHFAIVERHHGGTEVSMRFALDAQPAAEHVASGTPRRAVPVRRP